MATEEAKRVRPEVARVIIRRDIARKANRHRHAEVAKMQQEKDERERIAREKAEKDNPTTCPTCGK